jgi:hypothetical protein
MVDIPENMMEECPKKVDSSIILANLSKSFFLR